MADATLKAIVSGERITAEQKHKAPLDFHRFSICWFGTNHMPSLFRNQEGEICLLQLHQCKRNLLSRLHYFDEISFSQEVIQEITQHLKEIYESGGVSRANGKAKKRTRSNIAAA